MKGSIGKGHGASLAGARTMASMKHVGVNVAADPFDDPYPMSG